MSEQTDGIPVGVLRVFVVAETDYDHHAVCGVFASRVEADSAIERISGLQRLEPDTDYGYHVEEYVLGQSMETVFLRAAADGRVTDAIVSGYARFRHPEWDGTPETHRHDPWPEGQVMSVRAVTLSDALDAIRRELGVEPTLPTTATSPADTLG